MKTRICHFNCTGGDMKGKKLKLLTVCENCDKRHYVVPGNAKVDESGVFWDCACTYTLFLPLAVIQQIAV